MAQKKTKKAGSGENIGKGKNLEIDQNREK